MVPIIRAYWTRLHGILDTAAQVTGHDCMGYWTRLHRLLDTTAWVTGHDCMGYWTGLHGLVDRPRGEGFYDGFP